MNTLVKNIRFAGFALIFLLTACFRDGLDECPPDSEYYSYIKFVYDYNMAFEDLFHRQVCKIDVYLFDENGVYIEKLTDQVPTGSTFSKGYIMGLPEAYKEAVQFVAFAGLHEEQSNSTNMIPGASTINDLHVALNDRVNNIVDCSLRPMWHGNIAFARTRVARNDTTTISLTKNTNNIRIVLQSLDDHLKVDVKDFSFLLESVNGKCNAHNELVGQDCWYYRPYYTANDNDAGAIAELHTLRLMNDRENRLKINQTANNKTTTLMDINLNKYINALKLQEYSSMPLQEFLDREDDYKIIIFITENTESPELGRWLIAQISINSWIVRDQGGVVID